MTDKPPDDEAQRIKDGKAGRRPFPYPQIGGTAGGPIYAVHGHHLDELVATTDRLTAENERLKTELRTLQLEAVEYNHYGWVKRIQAALDRAALQEPRT
jgi:hypothetical protein